MAGAGLLVFAAFGRQGVARWNTVPARYGRVTVAVEGEALVVREEQVLFADVAGKVMPVAQEGERVPRGALVARIVPPRAAGADPREVEEALSEAKRRAILDEQSPLAAAARAGGRVKGASQAALAATRQALEEERAALARQAAGQVHLARAPIAGTVSYTVDGLEGILGPRSLLDLLNEEGPVEEVARGATPRAVQPQETVAPGRPAAKVVDNFRVWFVVDVPRKTAGVLPRVGARIRLRLRGGGVPGGAACTATVVNRRDWPERSRLLIAPVEYWPEFGRVRRTTLELCLGDYEGVWIPRSALVKRGDTAGVMVETWLGRQFQAVTVRGGDRERVVVDGLAPGTRVWKKPMGSG
ncbi:MAG: hypothetical protein QME79_01700 [Bacillota bacterium]|nr:hypothetical protein [Bacillota bacterium]